MPIPETTILNPEVTQKCLTLTGDKCNLPESLRSRGTSWSHLVQTLCSSTVSYSKLPKTISSQDLSISTDI